MTEKTPLQKFVEATTDHALLLLYASSAAFWALLFLLWFFNVFPVGHFEVQARWGASASAGPGVTSAPSP